MGGFVPTALGESLMPIQGSERTRELRGPDGSLIPTESISIQDTEALMALAQEVDSETDGEDPGLDSAARHQPGESAPRAAEPFEFDAMDELEDLEAEFEAAARETWREPSIPRYQIHIQLVTESSIP